MPYRTPRWLHLFQLEAHGHVRDRVGCRHRGATRRRYAHTIDPADPCSDDARRRQSASATTHRTIRAPTDASCPRMVDLLQAKEPPIDRQFGLPPYLAQPQRCLICERAHRIEMEINAIDGHGIHGSMVSRQGGEGHTALYRHLFEL